MAQPILRLNQVSTQGIVGAIFSFSLVLSFFKELRIPVAGILVHPYLVLLFPLALLGNLNIFQQKREIQYALFFYAFAFSLSQMLAFNIGEVLKIFAGIFIFFYFAKVVRTEEDFKLVASGFIFTAIYLSIQIITLGLSGNANILAGVDALDGTGIGNKNSQSQYILPGFFFICYLFAKSLKVNYFESFLWGISILVVIVGVAYTGNRSGYLGLILVLTILVVHFKVSFATIALVLIFGLAGSYLLDNFAAEVVERKLQQTTEGKKGDSYRQVLFIQSILIGLENPVFGLGLKGLGRELAARVAPEEPALDPHNLYGYLLGGGGVIVFIIFSRFIYLLFVNIFLYAKLKSRYLFNKFQDHNFTIWAAGFIVLFLVRSLFTRELIYSPHFMGAMGLLFSTLMYYRKRLQYEIILRRS